VHLEVRFETVILRGFLQFFGGRDFSKLDLSLFFLLI